MKRLLCGIAIVLLLFQNYAFAIDELSVAISEPSPTQASDVTVSASPTVSFINDFIPNPVGLDTELEWIELYNPTSDSFDLSGWYLDDAEGDSRPYRIPDGTYLQPNEYRLFSEIDLKLTLKNSEDVVRLLDPQKQMKEEIHYTGVQEGFSYSKGLDGVFSWTPLLTPGAENQFPPPVQNEVPETTDETPPEVPVDLPDVPLESDPSAPADEPIPEYPPGSFINDFIPNPVGADTDNEWIELYNSTPDGVDLSGWYLDDADGDSRPYLLPSDIYLSPGQYLLFSEVELKLTLKNSADSVRLLDPNRQVKDEVHYTGAQEGFSYSKAFDGTFAWTPILTPGAVNEFPAPPQAFDSGVIVFDSVLPDPGESGSELINLLNRSEHPIDLTNWRLQDGSGNFSVLGLIQINPGEILTITPTSFSFGLNNTDETLYLYDPLGNLIDQIGWQTATASRWIYNVNLIENPSNFLVTRVIDGDTFEIDWDGRLISVRMIGIDAPESVHPFLKPQFFGPESSQFLSELLTGKEVRLEFDVERSDRYGRLLAYVYLGDQFINRELVRYGYARAYTEFPFKYADSFLSAQTTAKQARIGLWKEYEVIKIKEYISSHHDLTLADILAPKEEHIIPPIPIVHEDEISIDPLLSTALSDSMKPELQNSECVSSTLKIDTFLPNSEKGISMEFIRLINNGDKGVCLQGWSLDDYVGTGSKPYLISGGSIAAGGIRTFRKPETGLALNNEDDCVTLIDPLGDVMDKICYGKTHPNEIFTHAGGDYQSPIKAQPVSSSKPSSSVRYHFSRDPMNYDFNFIKKEMAGRIASIDEDNKVFYLELEDKSSISVSYAHSKIDVSMAKALLSLDGQVKVDLMGEDETSELISIQPLLDKSPASPESPRSIYPYLFSFTLMLFGLSELRRCSR